MSPGRRLPLLYLALAHLCLVCAFAALALVPAAVAGFYYHPRALAVVHLVTLGWITASILGALYMIAPMAPGGRTPIGRADGWAFGVYAIGVTGMASHFWLDEPLGMAGSAAMAATSALWVSWRAAAAVQASRLPAEVKLHFQLAFLNLLLAASLGVAVAFDKLHELLPGASLDHVVAHAHLAAMGWATMIVMAAAYRLLPGILRAPAAGGSWVWVGAGLFEIGLLGLATCLYAGRGPLPLFAVLSAAGVVVFYSRVDWMQRRRRAARASPSWPEIGDLHVPMALVWLGIAAALGLALGLDPEAPWRQRAILAYGAAGLVGFLSQIVVGLTGSLLPRWLGLAEGGGRDHPERPPPPQSPADRQLQLAVLALWTVGVPLLLAGLGLDSHLLIRAAAVLLAMAALGGSRQLAIVWQGARRAGGGA